MGVEPVTTSSGARRALRKLELEAYAGVVSAFRAQGPLTNDKKSSLEFLCKLLGISTERHRAEVRRAVNDDLLDSVATCLTGYDTDKAWRKEGQKLASTNPRFVSRPASHVPQALTVATLAAAVGQKGVASVPKAPPTSGHGLEGDLKKALHLQLQNALKLVISHSPAATSGVLARQSTSVTPDTKAASSLRPQSAPTTPVKRPPTTTSATPSPVKNATPSVQSTTKLGTVAYKVASSKVVSLPSKKSVSTTATSQNTVATSSLTSVKEKESGGPSRTEATSKANKRSAIESLLCEETISPKNSPGPVKSEKASVMPTKGEIITVEKKVEVSKTVEEPKKTERMDSSQPVGTPADGTVSEAHVEQEKNTVVQVDAREVLKRGVRSADEKERTNTEAAVKVSTDAPPSISAPVAEEKTDNDLKKSAIDSTEVKNLASPPAIELRTKEDTSQSTKVSAQSTKVSVKATPISIAETAKPVVTHRGKVQIEVLKSAPSPPPPPPPQATTTAVAGGKDVNTGVSMTQEKDKLQPQAAEMTSSPQILVTPTQTLTTPPVPTPSTHKAKGNTPVVTAVVTIARKRSPSPSFGAPPPAKKPALVSKDESAKSQSSPSRPSPSTATTVVTQAPQITVTNTAVTVTATSAVKVGKESPVELQVATPKLDSVPPSQIQSEVSTDSLIQSLCSDSTSLEEDPDVSVLASQLGLDSVDSPVFNLSGFLSLIQPDLSALQPDAPDSGRKEMTDRTPSGGVNVLENTRQEGGSGPKENVPRAQTELIQPVSSVQGSSPSVADSLSSPMEMSTVSKAHITDMAISGFISAPPQPPLLTLSSSSSSDVLVSSHQVAAPALLSPVMLPEDPIPPAPPPPRPLVLSLSNVPTLNQPLASLGRVPATPPPPLTPTPLTPIGEGLLDISDIRSLVDESETMEGISQDVFESIEKLVNLDEQSTNATWK